MAPPGCGDDSTRGPLVGLGGACYKSESGTPIPRTKGRCIEMLYMIIERFKNGPTGVYRRFRVEGRLAPHGLTYVSSWVTEDLTRCYQVMECDDRLLLDQWMARWQDLIDFEVIPVVTSAQAAERAG